MFQRPIDSSFKSRIVLSFVNFFCFRKKEQRFISIFAVVLKSRSHGLRASIRNFGQLNVKTERNFHHKQDRSRTGATANDDRAVALHLVTISWMPEG